LFVRRRAAVAAARVAPLRRRAGAARRGATARKAMAGGPISPLSTI